MTTSKLTSLWPHLIYAYSFWFQENGCRAHIVVLGTEVTDPTLRTYIDRNNLLTLNITDSAVHGLKIDQNFVTFNARFSGKSILVKVPTHSVLQVCSPDMVDAVFPMPVINKGDVRSPAPTVTDKNNNQITKSPESKSRIIPVSSTNADTTNVVSLKKKVSLKIVE